MGGRAARQRARTCRRSVVWVALLLFLYLWSRRAGMPGANALAGAVLESLRDLVLDLHTAIAGGGEWAQLPYRIWGALIGSKELLGAGTAGRQQSGEPQRGGNSAVVDGTSVGMAGRVRVHHSEDSEQGAAYQHAGGMAGGAWGDRALALGRGMVAGSIKVASLLHERDQHDMRVRRCRLTSP